MRQPLELLIERYQKNLYAAAFSICGNQEDANDVVQDTFLRYHTSSKQFHSEEHLKAWLLRVSINRAKDVTRSFWQKNRCSLDACAEMISFDTPSDSTLFDEVMKLPEPYRIVIHLHYYEDLPVKQISRILQVSEAGVKMRLSRGRNLLRNILKEA